MKERKGKSETKAIPLLPEEMTPLILASFLGEVSSPEMILDQQTIEEAGLQTAINQVDLAELRKTLAHRITGGNLIKKDNLPIILTTALEEIYVRPSSAPLKDQEKGELLLEHGLVCFLLGIVVPEDAESIIAQAELGAEKRIKYNRAFENLPERIEKKRAVGFLTSHFRKVELPADVDPKRVAKRILARVELSPKADSVAREDVARALMISYVNADETQRDVLSALTTKLFAIREGIEITFDEETGLGPAEAMLKVWGKKREGILQDGEIDIPISISLYEKKLLGTIGKLYGGFQKGWEAWLKAHTEKLTARQQTGLTEPGYLEQNLAGFLKHVFEKVSTISPHDLNLLEGLRMVYELSFPQMPTGKAGEPSLIEKIDQHLEAKRGKVKIARDKARSLSSRAVSFLS